MAPKPILKVRLGNTVRSTLTWSFPLSVGSTVASSVCTVTNPSGTVTTPTVTSVGSNVFHASIPVPLIGPAGRWLIQWAASDGNLATVNDYFEAINLNTD